LDGIHYGNDKIERRTPYPIASKKKLTKSIATTVEARICCMFLSCSCEFLPMNECICTTTLSVIFEERTRETLKRQEFMCQYAQITLRKKRNLRKDDILI
jgi:hypothetical protein